MKENVNIPISMEWTTQEIIDVTTFFQVVETSHGKPVPREDILGLYGKFKEIVPSKSEEKQMFRQFDEDAEVNCWKTVQAARKAEAGEKINMTGRSA